MPLLRKIIFYLFAAIYLVVCPLLILRLLGFVYNPQEHRYVKTGIIYVSTNPPGAQVYINNLKANETTPTIIRDLPPNNYALRLELPEYQVWGNTIPVVARKATVLENILLTPPVWAIKPLSNISFEDLQPIGDENSLLIWHQRTINELYLLRLKKTSAEEELLDSDPSVFSKLFPPEFIYNNAKIIRFFTIEKSPFFVIHIQAEDKHKYLWVDARDKQIHIEDISDLLLQEPNKLVWEASDEKIIYTFNDNQVNRIDIKAKAIYPDINPKDIPSPKKPFFKLTNFKGTIGSENKNYWLANTTNQIGLWDNSQKSLQWLYDKGHNIQQMFWANSAGTILFRDDNNIFLLDREILGQARMQKITSNVPQTSFFYSEKTGKLYFIEPKDKKLSSIQILRHSSISPKAIADKLRLKEF